jgi:putative spermidine/putrescine transport system permease protein
MIAWVPLLGRNGLVNDTLMSLGVIRTPIEGLLYSVERTWKATK